MALGGSRRWINHEDDLEAAITYVNEAQDQKYKHDARASESGKNESGKNESGKNESHESRDMSLARLDRRLLRFIGPSPSIHWLAPRACILTRLRVVLVYSLACATCLYTHSLARRACNEKTCAPARSVALIAVSKRKMTSAGGLNDRRKKRAIRFLLRWLPQQAGDLGLRAAVKLPRRTTQLILVPSPSLREGREERAGRDNGACGA